MPRQFPFDHFVHWVNRFFAWVPVQMCAPVTEALGWLDCSPSSNVGVYITVNKLRCWPQYSPAGARTDVHKMSTTYTEKLQSHMHLRLQPLRGKMSVAQDYIPSMYRGGFYLLSSFSSHMCITCMLDMPYASATNGDSPPPCPSLWG